MNFNKIRTTIAIALFAMAAAYAGAQNTQVTYVEGEPRLRSAEGAQSELDYGSKINTGDSVVTGKKDQVELDQDGSAVIRVKPNTVFTIREIERNGTKEQVMTTGIGAVSMRFNKLAGKEPRVGTIGSVAGIRGTELTIYAGADGSSLFVVESGLVELSSAGKSVEIGAQQGLEVSADGVPGEKFSVIGRDLDFSKWAAGKTEDFLADPLGSLDKISVMMGSFKEGQDEWLAKYGKAKLDSEKAVEKMNALTDKTEQGKYRDTVWFPLALQTGNAILNYRYYTISALSLRRYVLGSMYLQMRSRNILTPDSAQYKAFLAKYQGVLADFRTVFEPYLSTVDY